MDVKKELELVTQKLDAIKRQVDTLVMPANAVQHARCSNCKHWYKISKRTGECKQHGHVIMNTHRQTKPYRIKYLKTLKYDVCDDYQAHVEA